MFYNILIGSCCVTLGQLCFSTMSALIKISSLKESQLLFGRFGIHILIAICYWIIKKPSNCQNWYGDQPDIKNIWLRGFTFTIQSICFQYAMIRLPIGDAECIFYQTPIVIAIFAWLFLNEKLPKLTPLICISGIIGILFVSQPPFLISVYNKLFDINNVGDIESLNIDGVITMFIAVFAWSITTILIRTAKKSHFLQLDIVAAIQTLFISTPILLILNHFVWKDKFIGNLNLNDWSFDMRSIISIILIAFCGFGGLTFSIIGYQYADATKVAWLEYITIIFAFSYQTIFFHDIPNTFEIIGVCFVSIACILSLAEEMYNNYVTGTISYHQLQNITTSESGIDDETDNA